MTRAVAILAWAGAILVLLGYLNAVGRGPFTTLAERHCREMKDRTAEPPTIEPFTPAEFYALPEGLGVAEYSGIERRAISLEGRATGILRATDGDYHVDLVPDGQPQVRAVTTEITPQWHRDGAGGWNYDRLFDLLRCDQGGATPWPQGPARVRLSGWLLYDNEDHWVPRMLGIKIRPRVTDWEIHPVTKIEVWNDARARWVEVRR